MKASVKKNLKRVGVVAVIAALAASFCLSAAACGGSSSSDIYIGTDGYWYIDGENTGVKATGEDGKDGKDGKDGTSSSSALEEITPEAISESFVTAPSTFTQIPINSLSSAGKFYTDYSTKEEAAEAANVLNIQMAQEGQVLLKNEDDALPLNKNERNVTLLGIAAADVTVSGGGSGASTQTSSIGDYETPAYDWETGLEAAGFNVNPKTMELYNNYLTVNAPRYSGSALEIGIENYSSSIKSTFKGYNDAAIVVLHRWGTENSDLATCNADGHTDTTDTELDLQDNEIALIKMAKQNFDKVIVILNSSNTMSVGELAAEKTADNLGVDAILWVGGVGQVGTYAAGTILTGETNPSGKTVDTWWTDVKNDPSYTNFSDMSQNGSTAYFTYEGNTTDWATVEYREDIYMGYRYTETGYEDMAAEDADAAESWYSENVAYPFGYGLSYTNFTWQLAGIDANKNIGKATKTITMKIKVTNTGSVAGKDVVEVYYSAPYTAGGIEKAAENLAGFAKTKMLEPGKSDTVTISFVAQDMASFDWNDANGNGFKGYELEAGTYTISARNSAHEAVISEEYTVPESIKCTTDYTTGATIEPVFVDYDDGELDHNFTTVRDSLLNNLLSRADGMSQPAAETDEDRVLDLWEYQTLAAQASYDISNDGAEDPWYVSSVPSTWTQDSTTTVTLSQLSGVTYVENSLSNGAVSDTASDEGTQAWESYMNSLSWNDLMTIVSENSWDDSTDTFGGHNFEGVDGPVQFASQTCWSTSPISAATWNVKLLELQGEMYGTQAIFNGNSAWHGGGLNTHRSPLNGRNFEYYSEDGTLAGIMGAAVVKGVTSKGVVAYYKHFFGNDQEYKRAEYGGVTEFATEQAYREIYLKPFEYVVKAGCNGLMTSFNRIGYVVNATNYAVHNTLLRDEWGFTGCTITDMWAKASVPLDLMIRAGDDIVLGGASSFTATYFADSQWDSTANLPKVYSDQEGEYVASATQYYAVRTSAQRVLYDAVNSNWMNNNADNMEMTASVYTGFSNSAIIQCADTTDFSVTLQEGQTLATGLSFSGSVITTDGTTPEGTYTYNVDITCDSWVTATGTITIKVCSPVSADGVDICGDEAVATFTSGTGGSVTFSSNYYTPHTINGVYMYVDWYELADGTKYNRDEDKSAADIVTYPASQAETAHEYSYTVTSKDGTSLPSGWTSELVYSTAKGLAGSTYQDVTGIVLTADSTVTAGTYEFTVTISVPYTMFMMSYLFPSFGTGMITVTKDVTIVVS